MTRVKGLETLLRESNGVRTVFGPFVKGVYSTGSIFCTFRVDPFPEGTRCANSQTGNDESCLPCKNGGNLPRVSIPHEKFSEWGLPASSLYKSTASRYRPVSYPDNGPL